jgi:hypothetical protein
MEATLSLSPIAVPLGWGGVGGLNGCSLIFQWEWKHTCFNLILVAVKVNWSKRKWLSFTSVLDNVLSIVLGFSVLQRFGNYLQLGGGAKKNLSLWACLKELIFVTANRPIKIGCCSPSSVSRWNQTQFSKLCGIKEHLTWWRVPKTLLKLTAIHHHQNPSRSSESDSASSKGKIISESNSKLSKISQHLLTKLQKARQIMIGTLSEKLLQNFHCYMHKWTFSYGQDWEQIIKL